MQPVAKKWDIANIPWQEQNADGTKYALLAGDKVTLGTPFTYAFLIPGGFWDAPHLHTAAAQIEVVKGELYLGYGTDFDPNKAQRFATGSSLIVPAYAVHFDGAVEDTLIVGNAVTPWATEYVKA